MPIFNHSLENTLEACSISPETVLSVAKKLRAEINDEPFSPYTDEEYRALLILAVGSDKSVLLNTFNFVDDSIYETTNSQSELVENLLKYPPTVDQIYKVLAIRQLNEVLS